MSKDIIIIGARLDGHAGVVLDLINISEEYKIVGFIDNTPELLGTNINGIPVIGSTDDLETLDLPTDLVHIAIGDNIARGNLYDLLKTKEIRFATLIHPTSVVSNNVQLGAGCYIGPNSIINTGSKIGAVTIINTGALIEHNNITGKAVHFAPGTKTAGRVHVEDYSFIGIGATILPDIHIGSAAMVGAGATVTKNVASQTTVIGYAANKYKDNIYKDVKPDVDFTQNKIYVAKPTLPEYHLINEKFKNIANSMMLSNFAKYSSELESKVEKMLRVKKALTLPNATSALMLALKAFDIKGEVILPSFTFSSTGHAVVWNGLKPVFADIDYNTFNIDPNDVERKITKDTSAIIATHIFGNPVNINAIEKISKKHGLKLMFDSAHALGSFYKGKPIGSFGDIECFSLSGTKVITSAEGGLVTSNDIDFMNKINLGRNYGANSDYDCEYIGLNGKMSEFHAAIAIESLFLLEKFARRRNDIVDLYKKRLEELPGISFQYVPDGHYSPYKDFAIVINQDEFELSRDELFDLLIEEGVYSKKYFFPLHKMKIYKSIDHYAEGLYNTEKLASNIICLPIFSHMNYDTVEKICYTIYRIWKKKKR